ncbi:hypothetical protein C7974DRAFT_455418 [Boeremia exigua]|uniref:uncharacterized protein n=1 Tax=Boeremia exigua TaxID=749465 RepID=UPI001E8E2143|nr:uncharacterized protein C7974DRAFT_455418 [Boeremia exigua]KAH6625378.1 hypothetical protein C7974DRAFT_455418 [Boeremia exigua]
MSHSDANADLDPALLTQAQLDQLFTAIGRRSHSPNPQSNQHVDESGFEFGDPYPTPPDSNAPSSAPTPEGSFQDLEYFANEYPTPVLDAPHPYPVTQHSFFSSSHPVEDYPTKLQQSFFTFDPPAAQPDYPTRRRSLSTSALDHSALAHTQPPNPTFIRLQAPRARSTTPDRAARRRRPQHSRHTSSTNASPGAPRSTPALVPTRIGDPFYIPPLDGEVLFEHPPQTERSMRVIQIGALAVREGAEGVVLGLLEEVEGVLRGSGCKVCREALRRVGKIREVLEGRDCDNDGVRVF